MRRCTYCFRFHPGTPAYCSHCGRTFGVKLCPRGHSNPRTVAFCSECGSAELSTPAPPASLLHHLSGLALYGFAIFVAIAIALTIALSALRSVNWSELSNSLVALLLMLGFLYWTTTLLPGPVKKLGRLVGHQLTKSRKDKRH